MYTIRLDKGPRPCWFAEWLDQDDTIPGVNYQYKNAATFKTRAEAGDIARQLGAWVPTVEEG